jgi:hypothetical protein
MQHGSLYEAAAAQNPYMSATQHQQRWELVRAWDNAADALDPVELSGYVDDLMDLPARERKELSRSGAIRVSEAEPACWNDPATGQRYRDAGNYIYSRAILSSLLYQPIGARTAVEHLNQEKLGDIVECILALAFLHPKDGEAEYLMLRMERMVKLTEMLSENLPSNFRGDVGRYGASAQRWAESVDQLRIAYLRVGWR